MNEIENGDLVGSWIVAEIGIVGVGKLSKYVIESREFGYKNNKLLKDSILHYSAKTDVSFLQIIELERAIVYGFGVYGLELPDADWFDDLHAKTKIIMTEGFDGAINLN